ncbi:MAG TPA: BPSS1780 family membrane protein [Usitatibacter sp.]|nr:BPSS1780 family membrane protein [Usitatibacter sp.]
MDASMRVTEVPASRGLAWIAESWKLFAAAPFAWLGLCGGWIGISFALVIVPFFGGVVANFLQPAFFASFAIAAYRQAAGERILMADLFSGFKRNLRALVNLGAILLLAEIAVFAGMALLGLPLLGSTNGEPQVNLAELADALSGKEWILFLGTALLVLLKGAFWFAPQLIAFHGMGTAQAMRWSVYAAISNLGALIVYGIAVFAMVFAAILPAPWVVGLVLVIPLVVISTYVGYREVFEAPRPQ